MLYAWMPTFQVLSDTHLEFYKHYPGLHHFIEAPGTTDCLCLCGDIGDPFGESYKAFLEECASAYKHTFIIAGNHEFYGHHLHTVHAKIRALCREISDSKLVYLEKEGYDIPNTDLRVIGTTLWTQFDDDQIHDIRYFLGDFGCIKEWSVEQNQSENRACVRFIQNELTMANEKKMIVMTHHAPVLQCGHPKHAGSQLSSAFKNDLQNIISESTSKIMAWVYGHDHHGMRFCIKDTVVASCQFGYPREHECQQPSNCVIFCSHKPLLHSSK